MSTLILFRAILKQNKCFDQAPGLVQLQHKHDTQENFCQSNL